MDIRTAVPADLDGIRRYDRHIPVTRLEDCIRRGFVDVLVDDGRIVGILRWNLFWQSLPFLDLIFLDDALRGQGWGTRMMSRWESNMAALGFDHVLLSTQSDETSKFFYEKLGYRLCGSFLPPGAGCGRADVPQSPMINPAACGSGVRFTSNLS